MEVELSGGKSVKEWMRPCPKSAMNGTQGKAKRLGEAEAKENKGGK